MMRSSVVVVLAAMTIMACAISGRARAQTVSCTSGTLNATVSYDMQPNDPSQELGAAAE